MLSNGQIIEQKLEPINGRLDKVYARLDRFEEDQERLKDDIADWQGTSIIEQRIAAHEREFHAV